jgi:superfamily II DNA or RNA helicase
MKIHCVKHMALVSGYPEDIFRKLTIKNTYTNKEVYAYEFAEGDKLWIPRALVKRQPDDAVWKKIDIKTRNYELYPYQKILVDNFLKANTSGIIQAGTGVGKTIMGIDLIIKLGLKSLVVVPTTQIFRQWVSKIEELCGFRPSVIYQHTCTYDKPITVAMLHTLAFGKYIDRDAIYTEFGTVIYDEVHRMGAEHFHKVIKYFWDKYRIGLSGTVERRDGFTSLFKYHIGDIIVDYSKVRVTPEVIVIDYYDVDSSCKGCYSYGDFLISKYYNKITSLLYRNALILGLTLQSYRKDRRTLILTDRLRHVNILRAMALKYIKGKVGRFTYRFKDITKQIIIGTYGSASTGLDIPDLDCLIFAMPRADVRQAIGRILRPKRKVPIVIDIVDKSSIVMNKFFRTRLSIYQKLGCKIHYITMMREDVNAFIKREVEKIQEYNSLQEEA